MDKFNDSFEVLWVWLHRGHVVRRACLVVAVWMTVDAFRWASEYANAYPEPGAQHVAMVVAVTGIPSALLAAMIKFYNSGRSAEPVKPGAN